VGSGGEDLGGVGDWEFDPRNGPPHRSQLEVPERVESDDRRRLREPIPLENWKAGRVKELGDFWIEWRAARDKKADAAAGSGPKLGEDQPVRHALLESQRGGNGAASQAVLHPGLGVALGPEEDPLPDR